MPRVIALATVVLFVLSCSQEKPTAAPSVAPHVQGAVSSTGDLCPTVAFNIELSFFDNVSYKYRNVLKQAADRWKGIIIGDLEPINYALYPYNEWNYHLKARVRVEHRVGDLIVVVCALDIGDERVASSAVQRIRVSNSLPVLSTIALNTKMLADETPEDLYSIMLHEMAHYLGFGLVWDELNLLKEWPASSWRDDPYFDGILAQVMFDISGGAKYSGKKVPVERSDDGHWRFTMGDELMAKG